MDDDGRMAEHHYRLDVRWTGSRGAGTTGYRDYDRAVTLSAAGKPDLLASADRAFRGDGARWNPEELLVASLSECHLLSYLHVAVMNGVVVLDYTDAPVGTMVQKGVGGRFTDVTLRPVVTIGDRGQVDLAQALHREAAAACFIASSVSFPVQHEPTVIVR